ncbi:hypothetical protein F5X97DRAFT_324083 [Nemania serpens]|nr:hypothetical protein F5X97DRAFT_324083 [Nemania serpens]
MEFISDNLTPLTTGDLTKVFAYSNAPATVITLLKSKAKLVEEEYATERDWDALLQVFCTPPTE